MTMSDHQDSEHFSYTRSWDDIENMLYEAEKQENYHFMQLKRKDINKKHRVFHMRKWKGLQGVIAGLRWVLGDKNVSRAEVLGKVD